MLNDYKQRSIETITNVIERVGAAFDVESPFAQSEAIARLSEAFKDIAEAPDVSADVIKMPIKSEKLCQTCIYDKICRNTGKCADCVISAADGSCKCSSVIVGDPCPHYIAAK